MINKGTTLVFLCIFSVSLLSSVTSLHAGIEPVANLTLKTNGGGVRPDYGLFIAQDLREIGIEVEVRVVEWTQFYGMLLQTHDYDMCVIGFSSGGNSPDMTDIYTEEGEMNLFNLNKNIPYGNISENMQDEFTNLVDPFERQQLVYDWQEFLIDKILPCLPLFSQQIFEASWSNLEGYEFERGLSTCLPYMRFRNTHKNQNDNSELIINAQEWWNDLSPLSEFDCCLESRDLILSLISEMLMQFDYYSGPLKTGLINDWEQISETHYQFFMRDEVFWNPSFDVSERDAESEPLVSLPISELMIGLKNGEFSTGSNQQVTAKDAVFTLLAMDNIITHADPNMFNWISNCYVDEDNPLSFHIHIDNNRFTPEKEVFPDFWRSLPTVILPEFFLNSSDSTISYTKGGVKCVGLYPGIRSTETWLSFSKSAFGCGKYFLDYYIENELTVLQASPYWFGKGAIDGTEQNLDIEKIQILQRRNEEFALFQEGLLDIVKLGTTNTLQRKLFQSNDDYIIYSKPEGGMSLLAFNLLRHIVGGVSNYEFLTVPDKEEYTKGIAVRKAICYSIDREEINSAMHDGDYFISHSIIYPSNAFYYFNDILKYEYNLEEALEWLCSPGYTCIEPINLLFYSVVLSVISVVVIKKRWKR